MFLNILIYVATSLTQFYSHGAGSYHAADSGRCKWSGPMIGSIAGNNIGCYNDQTIESCKAMCNSETTCMSIDYKFNGRCCLGTCRIGSECSNDNDPEYVYYACLDIDIPANKGNLPFITQTDYGSAPSTSEPCPIGYTLQFPGYTQGECQQNDENDKETFAGSGMTLFECAAACEADSDCVTFDYLNENCYLNEYCDKRDNDNYLACRKIDYNDFSSREAMEANGWQFTPNSAHMFIESGSDNRKVFCQWNPDSSYCGFALSGEGSTSVTMRSSGTVKITYGASFKTDDSTYVQLAVNGFNISSVQANGKGYSIIKVMKDDIVSFTEVGVTVINIHEFNFEPAPFQGVEKDCDWNVHRDGRVKEKNLHCWDSGISNSTCMEKCDQHEDCKAINWKKLDSAEPQTGSCCLVHSRDGDGRYGTTSASNEADYKYWSCKDPYERCDWSMAVMGAISESTIPGGCYEGKTPAQCKQLCEFTENCKSIDHQFDGRCCLHDCDIESGECALTTSNDHMYYTCDSRSLLNTAEDFYWGFFSYNIEGNGLCSEWANEGDLAGICCTPLTYSGGIGWPGKKYFATDCLTEDELVKKDLQKFVKSNHADRNNHIKKVCPKACAEDFSNLPETYGRR